MSKIVQKTDARLKLEWAARAFAKMKGKIVVGCEYMTDKEVEGAMWTHAPLVITFDDGSYIFAQSDDEGNEAGAYGTSWKDLPVIPVI